jgi:hypothetical protein
MLLVMMYHNNGGETLTNNAGWLLNGDHCEAWDGVTCDDDKLQIVSLDISGCVGSIFDITSLNKLEKLSMDLGDLTPIPNEICNIYYLEVTGDEESCNDPSTKTGCCNNIRAAPTTLAQVTADVLGESNCDNLSVAADQSTCRWMMQGREFHPAHNHLHLTQYLTVSTSTNSVHNL